MQFGIDLALRRLLFVGDSLEGESGLSGEPEPSEERLLEGEVGAAIGLLRVRILSLAEVPARMMSLKPILKSQRPDVLTYKVTVLRTFENVHLERIAVVLLGRRRVHVIRVPDGSV